MESAARPASWKILLAFAIIYFVWGSTFLSIRVGVREVPPFLLAGMRFVLAGLFLYGWMRLKGVAASQRARVGGNLPARDADFSGRLWLPVLGGATRAFGNRSRRAGYDRDIHHPAGNYHLADAAADCPAGPGTARWFVRGRRADESFVLARRNPHRSRGRSGVAGGGVRWSVATILTRRLVLPASKPMSAASQMLAGGMQLLLLAALTGEFNGFHS